MATTPPVPNRPTESETANIKLSCEDWEMQLQVSVPTGPTTPSELVPLAQSLTNAIVGTATQQVEAEGRKVLRDRIVEKLQDGLRRSLSK